MRMRVAAAATTGTPSVFWAVLVAVAFGLIWRHAMFRTGKGTITGRLVAVLLAMIIIWLLIAAENAGVAMGFAGGIASGIGTLFSGLAHFLSMFVH